MDAPWTNGPPSRAELETWLVQVKNLDRDEAREISAMYAAQSARGWSEESLSAWLDTVVGHGAGDEQEENFAAVASQAERMVREQEALEQARGERDQALADQRSNVIRNQVQSYYDRARMIGDAGPAYDPNAIANDIALRDQINPETGEPYGISANQMWSEIKGLSFNMGNLDLPFTNNFEKSQMTAKNPSRTVMGTRFSQRPYQGRGPSQRSLDAQARRYSRDRTANFRGGGGSQVSRRLTPTQALAMLGSMSEDELISLQRELYDAGLYGDDLPSWGHADARTRQAFIDGFVEAAQRDPNKSISRILNEMEAERIGRLPPPEEGPGSPGDQELVNIPDFQAKITSRETLSSMIDDMAQDLFGEYVSDDRKEALIAKLQQQETETQRQEYETSVADIRRQAQVGYANSQTGTGGGEIDRFMAAISGRESGGDYNAVNPSTGAYGRFQIMPQNWAPWATRAGLGPNAARTPQNQAIVAKRIMLDYYAQFGNWRDVAIAWFAGPGAVGAPGAGSRSDGNMTVNEYANDVMNRMGRLAQGDPSAQGGLAEVGGNVLPPIQQFDPAAEAEAILRAQDPEGWRAHEFGDRAIEFYSLLGGVI